MKKIILLDFDGVIHSYKSGWKGAGVIPDPPVDGAIEFIRTLINDKDYEVCIYSSRSKQEGGIDAMINWLKENALTNLELLEIRFPKQKPAAFITVDDRAICFDGDFSTLKDKIDNFIPWNKKEGI